ncbi:beta,beta-carotene 15,15'-dioxygenase-like [Ornithodoros turicata]|uniref:beta,beta-carotene 15,15'-dioxygenase-like n=1 Tax=Ornithodoros turicata TaxID=34597 RepID=UPI003138735A
MLPSTLEAKMDELRTDDVTSDFTRCFLRSCEDEIPTPIRGTVCGRIPPWLRGCLLRNGPGMLDVGSDRYNHVFDGLAMLQGFVLDDDGVTYQTRFLRSEAYVKNSRANRIVVSEFGTVGHTDPCASLFERLSSFFVPGFTDNALVNVMPIGDEYYAMTEAPYMHRIDPATLDTLSRVDLRRVVAVNIATAHPLIDPTDGTTYNVGSSKSGYVVVKFPAGESALQKGQILATIPLRSRLHPGYIHSFGLTQHYIVVLEQSLTFNILKALLAPFRQIPYLDCVEFDRDQLVCFHVVDKKTGKRTERKYVSESFLVFHHINTYEKDNHIVVDLCAHKDDTILSMLYTDASKRASRGNVSLCATPRRYALPLNTESSTSGTEVVPGTSATALLSEDGTVHLLHEDLRPDGCSFNCELPRLNNAYIGKPYRFFYAVAEESETSLIKMDLEKKTCQTYSIEGWVPTEPVFVARPGASAEDDGVVLSAFLNIAEERMVALVILDGESFEEVARAEFGTPSVVTASFHGWFGGAK